MLSPSAERSELFGSIATPVREMNLYCSLRKWRVFGRCGQYTLTLSTEQA